MTCKPGRSSSSAAEAARAASRTVLGLALGQSPPSSRSLLWRDTLTYRLHCMTCGSKHTNRYHRRSTVLFSSTIHDLIRQPCRRKETHRNQTEALPYHKWLGAVEGRMGPRLASYRSPTFRFVVRRSRCFDASFAACVAPSAAATAPPLHPRPPPPHRQAAAEQLKSLTQQLAAQRALAEANLAPQRPGESACRPHASDMVQPVLHTTTSALTCACNAHMHTHDPSHMRTRRRRLRPVAPRQQHQEECSSHQKAAVNHRGGARTAAGGHQQAQHVKGERRAAAVGCRQLGSLVAIGFRLPVVKPRLPPEETSRKPKPHAPLNYCST